jgi:hypothetical protein
VHRPGRQRRRVSPESDDVVGSSCGRSRGPVEARWKEASVNAADRSREGLLVGGLSVDHPRAVEGRNARSVEGRAARIELVGRHVVPVRPDRELRVVREIGVGERVPVIGAGWVGSGRDRDTEQIGAGAGAGDRELGDQPAVRELVVEDAGIAVVVGLAEAAESGPDGVDRPGAVKQRSGLGVDGEARVDGLDVVVGPDGTVRIGRSTSDREPCDTVADGVERSRRRSGRRGRAGPGRPRRRGVPAGLPMLAGLPPRLVVLLVVTGLVDRGQRRGDVVLDRRAHRDAIGGRGGRCGLSRCGGAPRQQ